MTIQTPPHVSADSYTDVATADLYHATRLNSTAWTGATLETKEAALKTATRRLEQEKWYGSKTHTLAENKLRWPRQFVSNADGQLIDADTVPLDVQHATAELALELLKAAADEVSTATTAATKKIEVGPITLELDTSQQTDSASTESLSGDIDALLSPYRESGVMGRLTRS